MCDKCICFYCVHYDEDNYCDGPLCWWDCANKEHPVKKCDKFEKEVDILTKK